MRLALALTGAGLAAGALLAAPAVAWSAPARLPQAAAHPCVDVVRWDDREITRYVTVTNHCATTQCVGISQPFARDAVNSVHPGTQEIAYSTRLLPQGKGLYEARGCTWAW